MILRRGLLSCVSGSWRKCEKKGKTALQGVIYSHKPSLVIMMELVLVRPGFIAVYV